tara:strand:- start:363 stop:818 length:456 start_codon:yes stop_codon:yes gene_type:complete
MLRILKIGIIFLLISNCGYSPIYSNQRDLDLNINIVGLEGEKNVNTFIAQKLSKYKSENSGKTYDVKIISEYEKDSLTKDETGNTTNFRLILEVDFMVTINGITKKLNFVEKFDIEKNESLFEQNKYEKAVRKDMMDLIIQKFISKILAIQ